MHKIVLICLLVGALVLGCNKTSRVKTEDNQQAHFDENVISFNPESYEAEEIVFYNLFSPVDLTYLVAKDMSYYNSSLLNPLNNISNYNESVKSALNLGVYGADLSYLWLFNQSQQAQSYLYAIQSLSDQLGIPRDFVDFTLANAENHSQELDTLINIARESYYTADNYLKENGKEDLASLILVGGWIETMYIAVNMYNRPDPNIVSKIAAQKFSVNSLYKLLQVSHENLSVTEYLLLIKKMNNLYDELQINFPPESLVIDTMKHRILVAQNALINLDQQQLDDIKNLTRQIREHIIN